MAESIENKKPNEAMIFADFLGQTPPGTAKDISDLIIWRDAMNRAVSSPDIQLHCDSDSCQGGRFFYCTSPNKRTGKEATPVFLDYCCRNCQKKTKLFALLIVSTSDSWGAEGLAFKLGEFPSFGTPIPSRVIKLISPDRELFIRGRRAENQALGIGAFAYYRRVVEN